MTKPKSGRYPWFKFHTEPWLNDVHMRVCSIAARGAWADMLCLIHEADADGRLLVGGEIPDQESLARLLRITVKEYARLEAELFECGVIVREDGALRAKPPKDYGSHSKAAYLALVEKVRGVCPRCESETDAFEKDHVRPVFMGGRHDLSNIQPLCPNCNRTKGRETTDWLAVRGLR